MHEAGRPHEKLTDRAGIERAVQFINSKINGCGFNFMEGSIVRKNSVAFLDIPEQHIFSVAASFDFSYYHDLELAFYDILFTDIKEGSMWWDHWHKDQLELAAETEPGIFEFHFNIGTDRDDYFVVRARGFSYSFEHVSYWKD